MPSIVVVDDDPEIRATLRFLLEDFGYAVEEAADGIEAIEFLQQANAPCVVLLDLMMPRLDGQGVLEEVARDGMLLNRHQYLLMTAQGRTIPLATEAYRQRYELPLVTKPFDIDYLLGVIDSAAQHLSPSNS